MGCNSSQEVAEEAPPAEAAWSKAESNPTTSRSDPTLNDAPAVLGSIAAADPEPKPTPDELKKANQLELVARHDKRMLEQKEAEFTTERKLWRQREKDLLEQIEGLEARLSVETEPHEEILDKEHNLSKQDLYWLRRLANLSDETNSEKHKAVVQEGKAIDEEISTLCDILFDENTEVLMDGKAVDTSKYELIFSKIRDRSKQTNRLYSELSLQESMIGKIQKELAISEKSAHDLEVEYHNAVIEHNDAIHKLKASMRGDIVDACSRNDELQRENDELQREKKQLETDIEDLQSVLKAKDEHIRTIKNNMIQKDTAMNIMRRNSIQSISPSISRSSSTSNMSKSANTTPNKRNRAMSQFGSAKLTRSKSHKSTVADDVPEGKLDGSLQRITELEAELAEMTSQRDGFKQEWLTVCDELEAAASPGNASSEKLRSKISALSDQLHLAEKNVANITTMRDRIAERNKMLLVTNKDLKAHTADLDAQIAMQAEELLEAHAHIAELEAEMAALRRSRGKGTPLAKRSQTGAEVRVDQDIVDASFDASVAVTPTKGADTAQVVDEDLSVDDDAAEHTSPQSHAEPSEQKKDVLKGAEAGAADPLERSKDEGPLTLEDIQCVADQETAETEEEMKDGHAGVQAADEPLEEVEDNKLDAKAVVEDPDVEDDTRDASPEAYDDSHEDALNHIPEYPEAEEDLETDPEPSEEPSEVEEELEPEMEEEAEVDALNSDGDELAEDGADDALADVLVGASPDDVDIPEEGRTTLDWPSEIPGVLVNEEEALQSKRLRRRRGDLSFSSLEKQYEELMNTKIESDSESVPRGRRHHHAESDLSTVSLEKKFADLMGMAQSIEPRRQHDPSRSQSDPASPRKDADTHAPHSAHPPAAHSGSNGDSSGRGDGSKRAPIHERILTREWPDDIDFLDSDSDAENAGTSADSLPVVAETQPESEPTSTPTPTPVKPDPNMKAPLGLTQSGKQRRRRKKKKKGNQ